MEPGRIQVAFDDLLSRYPTYKTLPPELQKYLDDLNKINPGNTPCCLQMSHALNLVGQIIPSQSYRRPNAPIGSYYYIQAVDELEQYLAGRYGRGEEIKTPDRRSRADMEEYLNGEQGILVFREGYAGFHTELWNTDHIVQNGAPSGGGAIMNADAIFSKPRVVFWSTIGSDPYEENPVPGWLQGWWEVYDGNYYYYYFNDENVVTYTTAKPANTSMPPYKMPMNEGDVTVSGDETEIIIDWNPADGGETQEIFTKRSPTTMNGTSNRYAPLFATKI